MPLRPPGEKPAGAAPGATTPTPSHQRPPVSVQSQRCSHNGWNRSEKCKSVCVCVFNIRPWDSGRSSPPSYKCLSVSERLLLSLHSLVLHSPQHYSTLTAWERGTEEQGEGGVRGEGGGRGEGGRRRVLVALSVLFVRPFS